MKFLRFTRFTLVLLISILFLQSCGGEDPLSVDFSNVPPPFDRSEAVRHTTLPGGVDIYVIEEGEGPFKVIYKDIITVKYTGRTLSGKIFDSSYASPFEQDSIFTRIFSNLYPHTIQRSGRRFPPLIEGFRKGILGIRKGEKRIIVVPPQMGSSGTQNGIDLEGKTLVFDIELVDIEGPPLMRAD